MSLMTWRFLIILLVLLTGSVSDHYAASALTFIIAVKDVECVYQYAPTWGYQFSGSFSVKAINPLIVSFRVPYPSPEVNFTVQAFGSDDLIYSMRGESVIDQTAGDQHQFKFQSLKSGFHKFCFRRYYPLSLDDHAEVFFKLDMVLNRTLIPGLVDDASKLDSEEMDTYLSLLMSM